ncbi:hypothetical protein H2203_004890 [Taxawa tesnikishii (nom. ined.)]|nr:hypothetical protein H2203_004890 [Dothideales sp. JES 119]
MASGQGSNSEVNKHPFVRDWIHHVTGSDPRATINALQGWDCQPSSLVRSSDMRSLALGTGASIFQTTLLPALESAQHEVILVTCFWARSLTLDLLSASLLKLSARARHLGRKIRVRICFSSLSLFQKLFHTTSPEGHVYAPSTWPTKLGLPAASELPGLEMEVKSIFMLPFSVMHPKFLIVDRCRVLLPSCNVSWEDWFEGCVDLRGLIVETFFTFWHRFWASSQDRIREATPLVADQEPSEEDYTVTTPPVDAQPLRQSTSVLPIHNTLQLSSVPSIFLPSRHHIDPSFRPFPFQRFPRASNPLNTFLLSLFARAQNRIYIQTPNLTSPPVLHALLNALSRGIDRASHDPRAARHRRDNDLALRPQTHKRTPTPAAPSPPPPVPSASSSSSALALAEEGRLTGRNIGALRIEFYHARTTAEQVAPDRAAVGVITAAEPVQSHLKLSTVDDEVVVLGSGNLDRASWYTSQELGVAFFSTQLAAELHSSLSRALAGRKRVAYDSAGV